MNVVNTPKKKSIFRQSNQDWNVKYIGVSSENWNMRNRQNGLSNGRTTYR
jgi:hypothetical protein